MPVVLLELLLERVQLAECVAVLGLNTHDQVEVRLGHPTSVAQAVEAIRGRPFDKLTIAKVDQKTISFVSVERPFSDECVAVEISFCERPVRCDRTGVECRS